MKRLLFVVLFAVVSCLCHAQDVIVTKDGDRIECIIKSENDASVSYVEWKDKKETLKVLPMSSVWSVTYDEKLKRGSSYSSVTVPSFSGNYSTPYKMPMTTSTKTTGSNGRGKYIAGGVLGLVGYFALLGGGIAGGVLMAVDDNPWGYVVIGAGIGGGITSLVLSIKSFAKASELKYASIVDVPVNDKVSVGLYDYAFAPAQSHGAGVGVKINF